MRRRLDRGARSFLLGGAHLIAQQSDDLIGPARHGDARRFQSLDFVGRGALAAGDDGARVAHPLASGGGQTGDEAHDRLRDLTLDELGGFFLVAAANLADHDDPFGLGVVLKERQSVHEARADDRVAADAHAGALAQFAAGGLVDDFIGQRAAAADDADFPLAVDVAGHDAHLASSGRDDAGAVRADDPRAVQLGGLRHVEHFERGHPLGNHDDQRDAVFDGLNGRVGGEGRRHVDDRGVGAGLGDRLANGVEHGHAAERLLAAFAGGHAADNLGAVFLHLAAMELAFAAGNPLNNQARAFINKNGHRLLIRAPASSGRRLSRSQLGARPAAPSVVSSRRPPKRAQRQASVELS